jgi:hypothetical protein
MAMYSVLLLAMVAMLSLLVLFPEVGNSATLFRIPKQERPDAERIVPVCVIALMVFSTFFFRSLEGSGHLKPLNANLHGGELFAAALIFAVLGLWATVWPLRFFARVVSKLRQLGAITDGPPDATLKLRRIARCFGLLSLYVAAFLARSVVDKF